MLIWPYGTDAPRYHRTWATGALIAVNLSLLWMKQQGMLGDWQEHWLLWFGEGLHPTQWVTNAFMHAGWVHVLGNMFFLWVFGSVVEGLVGWWRFLLLYVGIAAVSGGAVQAAMLGYEPPLNELQMLLHELGGPVIPQHVGALGASDVVFGVIAVAMLWAPRTRVELFVFPRFFFTVRLWGLALWYGVFELLMAWSAGFSMSSQLLHLVGFGVGLAAGYAALKTGTVESDGWDLPALLREGGLTGPRWQARIRRGRAERPFENRSRP